MSDITIGVLSAEGETGGTVSLPGEVFGADLNVPLIHQVVVAQLAAARQGTHSTKTRGEVSGGGIKPWRQKGTGRARQGSRRAPQWAGGGTVFGPQPRSYAQRTPKKMIAAALRSALSDRVADGKLFVVDVITTGMTPSTKEALKSLAAIGSYRSAVVVLDRDEDVAWLSLRNVPNVHAIAVDQLNVYDVVANDVVVFTKPALAEFVTRFGVVELVETAPDKPKAKTTKAKDAEPAEADEAKAEATAEKPEPKADKPKAEKAEAKADKPKADKAKAEKADKAEDETPADDETKGKK